MKMIFMAYITGSMDAVDFYCRAFDAQSKNCFKHADNDPFYAHAEIAVNEQTILAISEKAHYNTEFTKGNTMQFWLSFNSEESIHRTYDVLKEKAEIHLPLSQGDWCKTVAGLTDKYGIRWLLSY
jgi:uncharacterized glyoxalase superfamily protein PhnB